MTSVSNQSLIAVRSVAGRFTAMLVLCLMSVGCSDASSSSQPSADKTPVAASPGTADTTQASAEPMANMLSEATDAEATTLDGESSTADGKPVVDALQTSDDVVLAQANWPRDFPLPKWLEGEAAISVADGVSLRASGEADYLQNVSFFRSELQAAGWTLEAEEQPTPVMDSLRFSKGDRLVSVVVVAVVGGINVQLSQQSVATDQP